MASQSSDNLSVGQVKPSTTYGDYNVLHFVIQQALGKMQTSTLVKVVKCTNNGSLSPVGYVDIVPLVNQLDALGKPIPHETIFNVPYFRVQGGANAVILDPEINDIGIALFASRDISKVKNTKGQDNPGSFRQFAFSDAMYVGGVLNGEPTQYVQFSTAGIKMHSPTKIILDAPTIEITASTAFTVDSPDIEVNATDIDFTSTNFRHNGINVGYDHVHIGSPTAPLGPVSNTGTPIP